MTADLPTRLRARASLTRTGLAATKDADLALSLLADAELDEQAADALEQAETQLADLRGQMESLRAEGHWPVSKLVAELEESEAHAADGWAWLNEALRALGARNVFEIKERADALEQSEKALRDDRRTFEAMREFARVNHDVAKPDSRWEVVTRRIEKHSFEAVGRIDEALAALGGRDGQEPA